MSIDPVLLDLLCCPRDQGAPLTETGGSLECPTCSTLFPIVDGIVVFLTAQQLSDQEEKERAFRSQESEWYDDMYVGYTDLVEVPTVVRRLGRPFGPILDAGCGTGRITEALVPLGQPVVAVDYSEACLRRMQKRTAGARVLAVQSDLRNLPLRSGVMSAAISIEVHPHLRDGDRQRYLAELARVLAPGAPLSISTLNYNLVFRAWRAVGNEGAREGEHVLGNDYHYRRFDRDEFARELSAHFDVEELTGIRNIPARSLAGAVGKAGWRQGADKLLGLMNDRGYKVDHLLEKTPVAGMLGFFWLAKAARRRA
ncbi:MAG TPA: methyltransferase domain-containing protein [Acidimicrobiales bacterium]|nr:methyltransferase domain-containing protein [Acidimicrobiales bacterium]